MKKKRLLTLFGSICLVLVLVALLIPGCAKEAPAPAPPPAPPKPAPPKPAPPKPAPPAVIDPAKVLPKIMYWTAYDVGSSGYIQIAAMADALMKKYDVKLRVIPSGTSVGRLAPLRTGTATYGNVADENYYACNAMFEFAAYDWGPMAVRTVLAHPASVAVATAADANIKTAYDLKGKRVGYVPGASSLNMGAEGALAFAGLTWDDVEIVEFPSYKAQLKGMIEGKVDVSKTVPTAALMYELESSPRGIRWPEFPPEDKEGWARLVAVMPWMSPRTETKGAGCSEEKPCKIWGYRYPQCVTLVSSDETEVYAVIKALDESYDLYKEAMPVMWEWRIDLAGVPPAGAPFHDGAIKYLKEKGIWTAEHQGWNDAYLECLKKIEKAWKVVVDEAIEKGVKEKEFPAYWEKRREELGGGRFRGWSE